MIIAKAHSRQVSAIRIPKRFPRYFLLSFFISLTFRTFQYFPGVSIINELWLVAMFGFLTIPYLYWKGRSGWWFSSFELYILAMMALIPMLSAIAAWREFGQPLIYGVLAQRNIILGTGALALSFAFRHNLISLRDIEKALLLLAWATLGLYLFMSIFLNPASFANYGLGFVSGGKVEPFHFKFRAEFIILGFFYYTFLGFRLKSGRHWLMSLPFIAFLIIVDGGRSMLVSLLAGFAFFIWREGSFKRLFVFVPKLLIASLLFLMLLYASDTEYVAYLVDQYGAAFTVVTRGELTGDASANARITESLLAWPYIDKHWLMGNGGISNRWHGGFEGVLRGYFHPSDIGIIGVVYMYGLIGMLLFAIQFLFAWRYAAQMPLSIFLPMVDVVKGYLIYFAINSLVTGRFAHYSGVSFLLIAMLGCIALEARKALAGNIPALSKEASS